MAFCTKHTVHLYAVAVFIDEEQVTEMIGEELSPSCRRYNSGDLQTMGAHK